MQSLRHSSSIGCMNDPRGPPLKSGGQNFAGSETFQSGHCAGPSWKMLRGMCFTPCCTPPALPTNVPARSAGVHGKSCSLAAAGASLCACILLEPQTFEFHLWKFDELLFALFLADVISVLDAFVWHVSVQFGCLFSIRFHAAPVANDCAC